MTENNKVNKIIVINLFIIIISIYFLTASLYNCYNTDVSVLRIEVIKSFIERSELSVPEGFGVKGSGGKDYSWFGIGSSLLALPLYAIGMSIGQAPEMLVSTMNQLFGAATVVLIFLFLILLGYSKRTSIFVSIFYGLGTMAWPQAKHPFDHTIETLFILLSVYSVYSYCISRRIIYLLFSAVSVGFAFITRSTSVLAIPALFFLIISYSSKHTNSPRNIKLLARDIVLFFIGFLPFLLLSLWYNYYRFGSVFETGYQLIANRTGLQFFAGTSLWYGLSGFLVSPSKGFFYYSPLAILFFFSIRSFLKKHARLGLCFIYLIISFLLFLSKYIMWHGDWAWGPRYLLVITPFFIMPLAELIESRISRKRSLIKFFVILILILSVIIQILGISVDFQSYFIYLRFVENIPFSSTRGEGIQPINEPPPEIYFDWNKSPIIIQLKLIHNIYQNIGTYKYSNISNNAAISKIVLTHPLLNVFDFWWLFEYFTEGSYSGFIVAFILLLIVMYAAIKLCTALDKKRL